MSGQLEMDLGTLVGRTIQLNGSKNDDDDRCQNSEVEQHFYTLAK